MNLLLHGCFASMLALSSTWQAKRASAETAPIQIREQGLVGNLFLPASGRNSKAPAIIVLGGSEGGLSEGAAKDAALLAEHGFVVLQLAYFGAPGLPKELGAIPVEYFGTAIAWLGSRPYVDSKRIAVEGTSIGGEVALLVASRYTQIKAVVAAVPSSVVWPGISFTNPAPPSTFTFRGKPLPFLPYGWNGAKTSIYDLYALGLRALDQHTDAIIPVEAINGPVFLVCGRDDTLWPSCPMVDQVTARLTAKAFPHGVTVLHYPKAGHAAFGPPAPSGSRLLAQRAELGGTPEGNQAARLDDWPKMLAFMDTALRR